MECTDFPWGRDFGVDSRDTAKVRHGIPSFQQLCRISTATKNLVPTCQIFQFFFTVTKSKRFPYVRTTYNVSYTHVFIMSHYMRKSVPILCFLRTRE